MIFLGLGENQKREIFKHDVTPKSSFFPQYLAVIGPFKTMRGARFMRDYGKQNPHCRNVNEAEYLAKFYKKS